MRGHCEAELASVWQVVRNPLTEVAVQSEHKVFLLKGCRDEQLKE